MKPSDDDVLALVRRKLDADVDALRPDTTGRLAACRRAALSRQVRRPRFAPAVAFAASTAVLAIMLAAPDGAQPWLEPDTAAFDFVLAESELELIEDLDFYRWLDLNGYAG